METVAFTVSCIISKMVFRQSGAMRQIDPKIKGELYCNLLSRKDKYFLVGFREACAKINNEKDRCHNYIFR